MDAKEASALHDSGFRLEREGTDACTQDRHAQNQRHLANSLGPGAADSRRGPLRVLLPVDRGRDRAPGQGGGPGLEHGPERLDEAEPEQRVYRRLEDGGRERAPIDFRWVHQEQKKKGATLALLRTPGRCAGYPL
jgi:hypothetical protein